MKKLKLELELPFPPSVNSCYRAIPRGRICATILSKQGREYKEKIGRILGSSKPTDKRLMVRIQLAMPDKRKRDIDNYNKILLDSLTGILWEDDSQIDILCISREDVIKGGQVKMFVNEI